MALLKERIKANACCYNNQENYEMESHTWGNFQFPYKKKIQFINEIVMKLSHYEYMCVIFMG